MATTRDDLQAMGEVLRRGHHLHSAPAVAQRLLNLTYDLQFDIDEVVDCLRGDPALSAKILRVVNSPQYGLRARVTTVRQAVTYLGQRSLRLTTLTFSLLDQLMRGEGGELYQDYWRRSLTMAVAASRLAARRPGGDREAAYTAGLLSDLGQLVLAHSIGPTYPALARNTAHGLDLVSAERAAYGFSHAALTGRLLELWGFPAPLVDAARHHHESHERPVVLETIVAFASSLAEVLWTQDSPGLAALRSPLATSLNVDTDAFIELILGTRRDLEEQGRLYDVNLPAPFDAQALLDEARLRHERFALEAALEYDSLFSVASDPEQKDRD